MRLQTLGGILLASAVLAGCGGGAATPSSAAPASSAAAKPSTAAPASAAAPAKPAASASAKPAASGAAASASAKPAASGAAASAAAKPAASGSAAAKPAAAPSVPATVTLMVSTSPTLGKILADDKNKTVYTFDMDTTPDASACTAACLSTWPPLYSNAAPAAVTGLTGTFKVFTRSDNSAKQVEFGNKPLYYYAADAAPGDTKGDGVGGRWHVVKAS
jgi:predicted lipoprotein with Yx(FWY)xxD motif